MKCGNVFKTKNYSLSFSEYFTIEEEILFKMEKALNMSACYDNVVQKPDISKGVKKKKFVM